MDGAIYLWVLRTAVISQRAHAQRDYAVEKWGKCTRFLQLLRRLQISFIWLLILCLQFRYYMLAVCNVVPHQRKNIRQMRKNLPCFPCCCLSVQLFTLCGGKRVKRTNDRVRENEKRLKRINFIMSKAHCFLFILVPFTVVSLSVSVCLSLPQCCLFYALILLWLMFVWWFLQFSSFHHFSFIWFIVC